MADGQGDSKSLGAAGAGPKAAVELALFAGLAALLLAALLWFYGTNYSIHQDVAGTVLSGRLAVTLGDSFRDFTIYFPPAERAWASLAVRLADLTGARLDLATVALTGAAILVSAGLAYWVRRKVVGSSPLFLILSVAVLTILPILFKNIFGLREHFVVLGLWPYLVLRVSDPDGSRIGWRLRLLVGLWLGWALLFKYLYAVVVALVEVTNASVQRRLSLLLRIENLAAAAMVALYLFLWLAIDPAQRAAIGAMVSAIDANLIDTRTSLLNTANTMSFALLFLIAARLFRLPLRKSALGLALVAGAVIVAWAQGRWYSHHLFPITMAYIGWWWMIARGLKTWVHPAIGGALFLAQILPQYRSTAPYQSAVAELDRSLAEAGQSIDGKRVAVLTTHPSPYNQYLAAHGGQRWTAMMNNAYVSAELKPLDREENAGRPTPPVTLADPGRRMLHDEMLRLLEDHPPDVLILDHSSSWPLRYVDIEWTQAFGRDSRFSAILKRYRPVFAHKGKQLEYRYYVRAD